MTTINYSRALKTEPTNFTDLSFQCTGFHPVHFNAINILVSLVLYSVHSITLSASELWQLCALHLDLFFNRGGCARWGKSKVAEQQQLSLKGNSNSQRVASAAAAYLNTKSSQK